MSTVLHSSTALAIASRTALYSSPWTRYRSIRLRWSFCNCSSIGVNHSGNNERHFAKRKVPDCPQRLGRTSETGPTGAIFGSYLTLLRTRSLERAWTDFVATCFLHSQHSIEAGNIKVVTSKAQCDDYDDSNEGQRISSFSSI